MKHKQKILALLLAGVLLTAAVGCDTGDPVSTTTGTTTTTATTTTTTTADPDTPPPTTQPVIDETQLPEYPVDHTHFLEKIPDDLNFANMGLSEEQRTVQIAYVEGTNGEYTRRSLQVDLLDESLADKATMERNNLMEEQLGVYVSIDRVSDSVAGMEQELAASLMAGTCQYDILAGYQYFAIGMASYGYLADLADLSEHNADYIDLCAPYWGNAYNEAMSSNGSYYWITGDLAMRYTAGAYCTYVNTDLYEQYLAKDYGSIYDIVKQGDWTLDLLTEMATKCYEDNGTEKGMPDAGDTFGFGYEHNEMMDGVLIGAGFKFTEKDRDTKQWTLVLNQKTEDYKAYTGKLETLTTLLEQTYDYGDSGWYTLMNKFSNGKLLFTINPLYQTEAYLSSNKQYAVIPVPKMDREQESYRTTVPDACTIFGIVYCSEQIDQAAAALEFLCAHSYQSVTPAFYRELLGKNYENNPNQKDMLDLIHDGITTDFAVAWGRSLDDLVYNFRNYRGGVDNTVARNREKWAEKLAEFVGKLEF